jgi:probable rRNA maturation factor
MDSGDPHRRTRRPASTRAKGLRVDVVDRFGRPLSAGGLGAWLSRVAPEAARGSVSIALLRDADVRRLNRHYRAIDRATDVLSFPRGQEPTPSPSGTYLGDIAIAMGVTRRQARSAGHAERTELRILALHGLLHLIGYDHETDAGAMGRVESRLRKKGGLPTTLIARAQSAAATGLEKPRNRPRVAKHGISQAPRTGGPRYRGRDPG